MPSSTQASLGSAATAVLPGRPPCDAVHPPVTSAHIIGSFIMTPGGRWPSWGQRREVSPLVLRNTHPLSPHTFFQKSPLPPAPTGLCCWQPVRAVSGWHPKQLAAAWSIRGGCTYLHAVCEHDTDRHQLGEDLQQLRVG